MFDDQPPDYDRSNQKSRARVLDVPSLLELERIASRGWQGTSTERLGDWLLRAGGGFTGRANSVLVLGSPGVERDLALALVVEFYARHELPAVFQIPFAVDDPTAPPAAFSAGLAALGWQDFNPTSVMTAPLAVASTAFPARDLGQVVHEAVPSAGWLSGYHYRGRALPANAVDVLVNADQPTFLSLTEDGEVLGVARGVVTNGWLGVTAVTVAEQHRRRGVGSALMAAALRWAADRGAADAYLQVDASNHAALAMYQRGGFAEHHRYHYLRMP